MSIFYHVTEREIASVIMDEGFAGDWGDAGFGVYFWGTLESARLYVDKSGWDGGLTDPVILEISDSSGQIERIVPHPEWSGDYSDVYCVLFNSENEEERWVPDAIHLVDNTRLSL